MKDDPNEFVLSKDSGHHCVCGAPILISDDGLHVRCSRGCWYMEIKLRPVETEAA